MIKDAKGVSIQSSYLSASFELDDLTMDNPLLAKPFTLANFVFSQRKKWFAYFAVGFCLIMLARLFDLTGYTLGKEKTFLEVVVALTDPRPAMAIAGSALIGTGIALISGTLAKFRDFATDARDAAFSFLFFMSGCAVGLALDFNALYVLAWTVAALFLLLLTVYMIAGDGVSAKARIEDKWIAGLGLLSIGVLLVGCMFAFVPASEMESKSDKSTVSSVSK